MRSRDFTRNPEYPQFASDLKWKKADRKEGEREREVELGEEIYGRSTRTHEHKFPKKQILSKTSAAFFLHLLFYRVGEEGERMKGCVVSGGSGYGNCDFSEVNYIVFIRVIFTRGNTRNALRIS